MAGDELATLTSPRRPSERRRARSWSCRLARPSSTGRTCPWPPTPTWPWPCAPNWAAEQAPRWWSRHRLAYGSSGEHEGFAGTISIGQEATELLLTELGRSATRTFARVLLVSSPTAATARPSAGPWPGCAAESRDVSVWLPRWRGDAHAGRAETSLQLALAPGTVRRDRAEACNTTPIGELMPALRAPAPCMASAPTACWLPSCASADEGAALFPRPAGRPDRLPETLAHARPGGIGSDSSSIGIHGVHGPNDHAHFTGNIRK